MSSSSVSTDRSDELDIDVEELSLKDFTNGEGDISNGNDDEGEDAPILPPPSASPSSPMSYCLQCVFHFPFLRFCLFFIFSLQLAFHSFVFAAVPTAFAGNVVAIVFASIFLFLQTVTIIIATLQALSSALSRSLSPFNTMGLYLSMLLFYGYLYEFSFIVNPSAAFLFSPDDATNGTFAYWVCFVYFSVTTSTTTGYGDIVPSIWWTKAIAMTQMLINVIYVVGIFSIGLYHFSSAQVERAAIVEENGEDILDDDVDAHTGTEEDKEAIGKKKKRLRLSMWNRDSWIYRFFVSLKRDYIHIDRIRSFIYSWCLPLTLSIQMLLILVLNLYDASVFAHAQQDVVAMSIVLFVEIIQFVLIVFMSLSLVRGLSSKRVNPWFLLQSYCSVVVLFASFYVVIFMFAGSSSFDMGTSASVNSPASQVIGSFLWFSLVSITSTGFGDIYCLDVAARFFATLEMLTGVFYNVVILGIGISGAMPYLGTFLDTRVKRILTELREERKGKENENEKDEVKISNEVKSSTLSVPPSAAPVSSPLDDSFTSQYPHLRHVEHRHTVITDKTTYEEWMKIRKEMLKSMNEYQKEIGELKRKVELLEKENKNVEVREVGVAERDDHLAAD